MTGKTRRAAAFFCFALLLSLLCGGPSRAEGEPRPARLRALLVGCDQFISQPDTGTAAENNVRVLSDILMTDSRRYALIRSYSGSISTVEAFKNAVLNAFQGAVREDISLIYIASHGIIYEADGQPGAALLLSDGEREMALDAETLENILNRIPGKKIVILDGCYTGAMIGKGVSRRGGRSFLSGPDYKVLCSAGGSEASWYWQGAVDAAGSGGSYFATVLAYGLGLGGEPAADANRDGAVTLQEMYGYLCANYAASTPQIYPVTDDEFPLYTYDENRLQSFTRAVTDVTFEDTLLTAGQSEVTFSFTVQRQVTLYYQIVYHQDGVWQFGQAQHYLDGEQLDGSVLPGRKMRTLSLDTGAGDAYGYAMIQLITLEEGRPVFQGSRLLCVQPAEGTVHLQVDSDPLFCPGIGQELRIFAQHEVPCALTVSILDHAGKSVRRLAYESASRPQQMNPAGSVFYWDGLLADGKAAPPGAYRAQVKVRLGGRTVVEESEPFELVLPSETFRPVPVIRRDQFKTIVK